MANTPLATLNIDPQLFQPILEAELKNAMAKALGDPEALVQKLVSNVLSQKVNGAGNVSNSSYENQYNLMDLVFRNTIQAIVKQEVAKFAEDQGEVIRTAIKKYLSTKKNVDSFANSIMEGVVKCVSGSYSANITMQFKDGKNNTY